MNVFDFDGTLIQDSPHGSQPQEWERGPAWTLAYNQAMERSEVYILTGRDHVFREPIKAWAQEEFGINGLKGFVCVVTLGPWRGWREAARAKASYLRGLGAAWYCGDQPWMDGLAARIAGCVYFDVTDLPWVGGRRV